MKIVFADTSYYIALVNPHDIIHNKAVDFCRNYRGDILTTEYVLIEVGNFLSRPEDRPVYVDLMARLKTDPQTYIVPSSTHLFEQGFHLFSERLDKSWSIIDCISFVIMCEHSLTEALSSDRHFIQAGFKALLVDGEIKK